jgi:hypothetical protein
MIFANTGELLLRVLMPSHDILESLTRLSYARRRIDNWHFDVDAFPTARLNAWERLWVHYSKLGTVLAVCWPLLGGLPLPLLSFAQA